MFLFSKKVIKERNTQQKNLVLRLLQRCSSQVGYTKGKNQIYIYI